jgi:hypothetical protein
LLILLPAVHNYRVSRSRTVIRTYNRKPGLTRTTVIAQPRQKSVHTTTIIKKKRRR